MDLVKSPRVKSALRCTVVAAVLGALPFVASPSEGATGTFSNPDRVWFTGHPGIPPPWAAEVYPSTISVSGVSGTITDVNVVLRNLTCIFTPNSVGEEYPEDADIALVGPTGVTTMLLSDVLGDNQVTTTFTNLTISLNDEAADVVPFDTNPYNGTSGQSLTAKPSDDDNDPDENGIASPPDQQNPGRWLDTFPSPGWPDTATGPAPNVPSFNPNGLAVFDGTDANGTWSLYFADDFAGPEWCDLNGGWSLEISTDGSPEPTSTTTIADPSTTTTAAPSTTTTAPLPVADLAVDLTGPSRSRVGRKVTFTETVTNLGPAAATSVTLINDLPGAFSFSSLGRLKGMQCTTGFVTIVEGQPPVFRVSCTVARLAAGASASVAVTGKYTQPGTYTNSAGVSSSSTTTRDIAGNNRDSVTTVVT